MDTNRVLKHQISFMVCSLIILSASICRANPTPQKAIKKLAETQISGVINTYTPIVAIENGCSPIVTVEASSGFNTNDKVLIIQMQGATITPDNTADYGTVISSGNAGNYEFAHIKSINGNSIVLQNSLLRKYSVSGKVQLVRVPEYQSATVTDTLTGLPWNGKSGGIIVLSVSETLTLKSNIVASRLGFRGALLRNATNFPTVHTPDYVGSNSSPHLYAPKGEGIAGYGIEPMTNGKGAPANGGGGGNNHNAGGGGGANIGAGGTGGYGWNSSWTGDNKLSRGIGGHKLFDLDSHLFLGGGGGSGHTNQSGNGNGGNGGGIVIVIAGAINSENQSILSEGNQGGEAPEDGAGGGGAGGAIVVSTNTINGSLNVSSRGGNGGNIVNFPGEIGPGGGGGGGGVYFSTSSQPSGVTTNISGGLSGRMVVKGTTFGASDGGAGGVFYNIALPVNVNTGTKVANAGEDHQICMNDSTTIGTPALTGYTYSWQPTVGLRNPNSSQTSAGPPTTTRYILTVTNTSGCADHDTVIVTISTIAATVSPETEICAGNTIQLHASGGTSYEWFPTTGLDNPRAANPFASPSQTTLYGVIVTQGNCVDTAYTTVKIHPTVISHGLSTLKLCNRNGILIGYPSVEGYTYQWNPVDGLDNPASSQTNAQPSKDTRYILTVVNKEGCVGYDTVDVHVNFDNKLEIMATSTDSVLVFDSTFVGVKSYRYIKLFNRDSVLPYYLTSVSMMHNIYFSIPQSQLPLVIQPLDTAYLQVCFAPEQVNVLTDTLILYDTACTDRWIPMRSVGVLAINPALTRCRVPVYITAGNQDIVFSISNPYPHPANNHVVVDYELSGSSDLISVPTNAVLRDMLGNTLAIALPENIQTSENTVIGRYTFQTEHLPAGVYSLAIGICKEVRVLQIVIAR